MKKHLYLFCFLTFSLFAQSTKEIYNLSTKAYQENDFVTFLKLTQKLDSIRPSHPTYMYNLACAHALNKNINESISVLEKCILMNHAINFSDEKDLDNIKNDLKYPGLQVLQSELQKTVASSIKVTELSEKDLHPESIFYLKKHKIWLANSIRHKKIVSFDIKSGVCSNWLYDLPYSVFAMKADANEQYLWVTTTAIPEMIGFSKEMEGKSEILKIDIKAKKIIKRFYMDGNHTFGDIIISKKGEVYLSDSGEAIIYKIENDKLSVWLDLKKEAYNLQGLTFNKSENQIFISDYLKGILWIDLKNVANRKWIDFPKGTVKKGIDGLIFYEESLIAIQNGVKPHRIMQLNLSQNQISSFKVIDHNRLEMIEPTNGIIDRNSLYFIGNSPWSFYDKNSNLEVNKINPPQIFKYTINEN